MTIVVLNVLCISQETQFIFLGLIITTMTA